MLPEILSGSGLFPYLPLVILICSIVQSLMGVGLLLFGTPTLLLMGLGFGETLAVLLPCSVAVNLCQLRKGLPRNRDACWRIAWITLPMIFLGLLIALWGIRTEWMPSLVGATLLGLGILRLSSRAISWLNRVVADHQNAYMACMGLMHGLSNMGGGLLVVYAGSLSEDKEEIRRVVALGYLAFALTQLLTLAISQPQLFQTAYAFLPLISLVAYLAGDRLFQSLSAIQYGRLVTGLILVYGIVTVGKALG